MAINGFKNHPYIPNSVPEVQEEMLRELGLNSLEELHEEIPDELKLKENMNLPKAFKSEYELRRHVEELLSRNKTCKENLNFLGAGCWQHYVPAICDEINSRGEFLTAYGGEPYNDHGRFQALFEYQSLVAELVDMDIVNVPTMDWPQAAATSVRMASRITGRKEILVPRAMDREKFLIMKNYCGPDLILIEVDYDKETGQLDLVDLKNKISNKTAAVYFENPSFLGFIEENGQKISYIAHEMGAISVVGVDPSSLGVLAPPSEYGADIICGDLQPLGMHMNYGGGQSGFIATRDEEKYVMEFPSRLFGIAPTCVDGEYGFGDVAYDRTSFGHHREHGKEYVGTQSALWGITAGVYLATMGPKGMEELGQTIMQKSQYAIKRLSEIKGIKGSLFNSISFKEFVVDFNETGKTVKEINRLLMEKGIFGGKDLSKDFPEFGQSALYCVTEIHTKTDIDKLVTAVEQVINM
ncbi:aminomethyl-transferring glycine dehydrogenase subunit GcvPA [Paramaledivibacter caminithermalis]|jgi:glycine dehydrogenase subunit 1|uniref:Glycine dehydrogenase subunit 1 n=1 Tax=Paramaledivibacter caminithermalis (strain DSM 15212 / CIP 107654 / DViRD3) TaxID=1121301 RepID=A0A1M6QB12_PARC5|nr:aminomethyl-transferring glycine dehydrogenase subunit GcvPA [Paramaledivibacter caminithermalis]SHK17432.1 glycine dehydrogenase subunit 1 [Paramaledivibacter caminithermalis DSM 15212]